jgi:hypothetical protein
MQELRILKQLINTIQEQWDDTPTRERSEIAYTLWEAQSSIKTILDTYKDELRGYEESRVPVSDTAHFHVIESKSNWVLKSDADLLALQRELGSMFNVLFYAKLQTTPKFEETLVGLPERQKTALFNNVEQRQKKATVRLVKQPIRKRT